MNHAIIANCNSLGNINADVIANIPNPIRISLKMDSGSPRSEFDKSFFS